MSKLHLTTKYPGIENNSTKAAYVIRYFLDKHARSFNLFKNCVRREAKSAGSNFISSATVFNDIIEKQCVGTLLPFAIYHRHEIEQFVATKIVIDFCKKKIEEILQHFSFFSSSTVYCLNGDAEQSCKKIAKIHFIVTLAQIFSFLKFAKKNKLDISKYLHLMAPRKGNFISQDLFNQCLMTGSSYIATNSTIDYDTDGKRAISLLFDKYSKLYDFITSRSVAELTEFGQESPDFNVLTCKYLANKSHITTSYAYKYFIKNECFYLCDVVANKSAPTKNNPWNYHIQENTLPQNELVIEI